MNTIKPILSSLLILLMITSAFCIEYHVAKNGNDANPGSVNAPFKTIQAAANIARAGDVITVHEGTYREWVNPRHGGESDTNRITYQAAKGEKVEIKGSEIINNWKEFVPGVWKASISNSFFGDYNPYQDTIKGDWFFGLGRVHHTGEVYSNGKSLFEYAILERVLNPKPFKDAIDKTASTYAWYCESDEENTYIYANFKGADPNKELVEINVRKSCFYPDQNNINYITVSGFHMSQAATQWAPPTAEQIGLIGTNWSKGWIIENNVIRNSKCSGITLGKHGDEFDNTSEDSAEGYVETIKRALARGWSKENIGSHIIRNNIISDCEQTGICGSMGAVFSQIYGNYIYDIYTKRQFFGYEIAGIKIHASIDMLIKNNRINNAFQGIWLDWMAQGVRVTSNLLYNNDNEDLFCEVNHGPFLVDNNIFLSKLNFLDWSEGGAFIHNLFAGRIEVTPQERTTPYHLPHSTQLAGLSDIKCGDNRYLNNIFISPSPDAKTGLQIYDEAELPMMVDGNVYLNGAKSFSNEENYYQSDFDPQLKLIDGENVSLSFVFDKAYSKLKTKLVKSQSLGKAKIPDLPFENADGSPFSIDQDYFGHQRSKKNPTVGPFENPDNGLVKIQIW